MIPSELDRMSWAMADVYTAVTDKILINMARYFPFIKETGIVPGAFEWQARMLGQMGQINRETEQIILDSLGGSDEALRQTLENAILNALKDEEPALRKAAKQGLANGPGFLPPQLAPNQMQAFQYYYRQSADKLNLVNTVMLESTEAAYRETVSDAMVRIQRTQKILNNATGEVVTGVSSWNTAMHDAVKKMVDNGLTGFIDHGGHRWSPEAYAAMDIKTTVFNTARAAVWERADAYGVDTYQVSSHNGARPLCYPWQGKVISKTDNVRDIEDLNGNTVHVYAQSETSYGEAAGLFGVNCKHYPMTFIPGVSTIRDSGQDPEDNEKTYAESQQQRKLERKLREEKRDLEVMKAQGADPEAIRQQQDKVRKASADIDQFCDETGRARRRSREYRPVDAKFDGAKTPPYGVPVANVTNEYMAKAKPGVGEVSREHGEKQKVKQHEIDVAAELIKKIGGNVTLIDNSGQISKRDLLWGGKTWEVKRASSVSAAEDRAKTGMHQIEKTGGNLVIDCWDDDFDASIIAALHSVERYSSVSSIDVIFMHKGSLQRIYRYKKR